MYVATPSVLVIARSAIGVSVSVSLALALPLLITEPGTASVAVLVMLPIALDAIVAGTVYVIEPPFGIVTVSLIGPEPEPQKAPPAGAHVHAPKVTPAGGVSLTTSPATVLGPLLETVIV